MPLKSHGSNAEVGPGRRCMPCATAGNLQFRKTPSYLRGTTRKPVHPPLQRATLSLYPDQKTNLPSDSEGDAIFITLDYLQDRRRTTFLILENKQICSLPGAALQISLNKATHALCSGGLQKCEIHHSTLLFYMSSFHDSQGSLGVRRTQACLLS